MSPPLLTVGHGRLDADELGALLRQAQVGLLVDVRRFPGSRANPAVARDALPGWLPEVGIGYRWEERLGGRRRLPDASAGARRDGARDTDRDRDRDGEGGETDAWWRVEQFRAYAAHTRSAEFAAAMADLFAEVDAGSGRVAVMCSESVWWRCHRRLIADVTALGHGRAVEHLRHVGRLVEHPVAEGARRVSEGVLVWDGR
jgi:uncharacterized protein (DUF488 family)